MATITKLTANRMTDADWVAYYLKHPSDLLAYIQTVAEVIEHYQARVAELEAAQDEPAQPAPAAEAQR